MVNVIKLTAWLLAEAIAGRFLQRKRCVCCLSYSGAAGHWKTIILRTIPVPRGNSGSFFILCMSPLHSKAGAETAACLDATWPCITRRTILFKHCCKAFTCRAMLDMWHCCLQHTRGGPTTARMTCTVDWARAMAPLLPCRQSLHRCPCRQEHDSCAVPARACLTPVELLFVVKELDL